MKVILVFLALWLTPCYCSPYVLYHKDWVIHYGLYDGIYVSKYYKNKKLRVQFDNGFFKLYQLDMIESKTQFFGNLSQEGNNIKISNGGNYLIFHKCALKCEDSYYKSKMNGYFEFDEMLSGDIKKRDTFIYSCSN